MGTFAPIAWSSLKITPEDFQEFFKINNFLVNDDSIYKLCAFLEAMMPKNNFKVHYDYISSDLTFDTMDKIIDFFYTLLKAINKTFKSKLDSTEINWKPICRKFRLYFK